MESTQSWLPLTEYSLKHEVSISTLRRRIKAENISFRLEDGKYFILDEASQRKADIQEHRPSLKSEGLRNQSAVVSAPPAQTQQRALNMLAVENGESVITAANRLLADLKKAYTQVLHEKEEQIMVLKEEIVDLKTLVKILESENSRLKNRHQ